MNLLYVTDNRFYIGPDSKCYYLVDYAIEYILERLPKVTEFVLWARLHRTIKTEEKALLPSQVGNCKVRVTGPILKNERISQWPLLLIRSFFALKKEIDKADIVFLRMPMIFPCMAFYMLKEKQIVISHQITDPATAIPLAVPKLKIMGRVLAKHCKKVASRADKAFFVSNALRNIYGNAQRGDIVCNEIRITKDMIVKNPRISPHHPPRIVYVGRLTPEKGLDTLIQSIAEVKKDIAVELWVIGTGPLQDNLKLLANNLGIADSIKWLGYRNWKSQLFGVISQADTLVLPSYSEGLGLVMIEGMSQGLVVIGSSVGGIPEILEGGNCGILVPPADYKKLADAIKRSVTDMSLRNKLINQGLKQAKKNCIENETGKLIDEIAVLIGQDKHFL